MINLSQKEFLPQFILISLLFIPSIVAIFVATIVEYDLKKLILFLSFLVIYLIVYLFLKSFFKKNRRFLLKKEDKIKVFNNYKGKPSLDFEIDIQDISFIEYLNIISVKGWVYSLISYHVPKCVFITLNNGRQLFLGYLNISQVEEIFQQVNIKII